MENIGLTFRRLIVLALLDFSIEPNQAESIGKCEATSEQREAG
jgi:hypothetical protein